MLREHALAWLPALVAAVMLAGGSATAMPMMGVLCNGGSAEIPGKAPRRDCDTACHAGCTRRRGR